MPTEPSASISGELIACTLTDLRFAVNNRRAALRKLLMLDAAVALTDLKVPPGNQLESLRGERAGQHSINFPGIYEVVRGDRAISADTTIRLGKYFGLPAQFWLNLQNDYDLRIAEGRRVGKGIEPRNQEYRAGV